MEKGQSCFYRGGSTLSSSFQDKIKSHTLFEYGIGAEKELLPIDFIVVLMVQPGLTQTQVMQLRLLNVVS